MIQANKVHLIDEAVVEALTESSQVNELLDDSMVENFDKFKESLRESEEAMFALTKQQLKVKDEVVANQQKMQEIELKKQEEELKTVKKALVDMENMWERHYDKLDNHQMVGLVVLQIKKLTLK